jgi:hypothetical protein
VVGIQVIVETSKIMAATGDFLALVTHPTILGRPGEAVLTVSNGVLAAAAVLPALIPLMRSPHKVLRPSQVRKSRASQVRETETKLSGLRAEIYKAWIKVQNHVPRMEIFRRCLDLHNHPTPTPRLIKAASLASPSKPKPHLLLPPSQFPIWHRGCRLENLHLVLPSLLAAECPLAHRRGSSLSHALTAVIETETGIGTEIEIGTEGDATGEIFDESRVIFVSLEIFATTEKKIAALISDMKAGKTIVGRTLVHLAVLGNVLRP